MCTPQFDRQRYIATSTPAESLPPPYKAWTAGAPEAFWTELSLSVRAQGAHFVDAILAKGQDLVRASKYVGFLIIPERSEQPTLITN